MSDNKLLPNLFRTEYRKIVAVLCSLFGIEHIEIAEDIVSDTFLSASELWSMKGIPENPTAWLYTVAKNKTRNYLKRNTLFSQNISKELKQEANTYEEIEIDLSVKNITDSQLAMIFAVCNPCISSESQIALALNLLCGFGIQEISDAFLTNKEVIYKRLNRAKEKLKTEKIRITYPTHEEIDERLDTVLTTLYLLFSEGYYSVSQNTNIRKELCLEAMRLVFLLKMNVLTAKPSVFALLALMCYHTSRFEARTDARGETILYEDQDTTLWNRELIEQGNYYLNKASFGAKLTRFHLEAGIAYWHTQKEDTREKWENILQLYNLLLQIEYSPIAALNRTYAYYKTYGKERAIKEAEKLNLDNNHLYFSLLATLYKNIDNKKALEYFKKALTLTNSNADQLIIMKNIKILENSH